jgi:hypothetical protein
MTWRWGWGGGRGGGRGEHGVAPKTGGQGRRGFLVMIPFRILVESMHIFRSGAGEAPAVIRVVLAKALAFFYPQAGRITEGEQPRVGRGRGPGRDPGSTGQGAGLLLPTGGEYRGGGGPQTGRESAHIWRQQRGDGGRVWRQESAQIWRQQRGDGGRVWWRESAQRGERGRGDGGERARRWRRERQQRGERRRTFHGTTRTFPGWRFPFHDGCRESVGDGRRQNQKLWTSTLGT